LCDNVGKSPAPPGAAQSFHLVDTAKTLAAGGQRDNLGREANAELLLSVEQNLQVLFFLHERILFGSCV
jgi:hypothetical protein